MTSVGPSREVFDVDDLLARCMGNLDFAARVLAKFRHRLGEDLAELEQALLTQDSDAVARTAHRIKGASASVSATRLRKRAAELEHLGQARRFADMAGAIDQLRHEWDHFLRELSALETDLCEAQ